MKMIDESRQLDRCPLCERDASGNLEFAGKDDLENLWRIDCKNCGKYAILADRPDLTEWLARDRARASATLKRRMVSGFRPVVITRSWSEDGIPGFVQTRLEELIAECPEDPLERLELALLNLASVNNRLGGNVQYTEKEPALLLALERDEFIWIVHHLDASGLAKKMGGSDSGGSFALTLKGWEHVRAAREKRTKATSKDCFVAMNFDPAFELLYDKAIYPAIRDAGFNPIKVNRLEYNDQITDEIIIRIRGARFLIAEMTGQKHGVYFEAGFAKGLSLPVIFCCKKEDVEQHRLHFDIRQYNHIVWESEEELKLKLTNRIKRTIL